MPTHQHLSPLRQSVNNPKRKGSADLVLRVEGRERCCVEFPKHLLLATEAEAEAASETAASKTSVNTIAKMFTQELKNIADKDPLHDLTVQVLLR